MIKWIKDVDDFKKAEQEHKEFLILFFYADFSANAKRALKELEYFSEGNKELPVYALDAGKIKNINTRFGVESVPAVLALESGKVIRRIEGVESARFYERMLSGAHPSIRKKSGGSAHKIIVYTGPGCPACGSAKTYLRKRGAGFREVDISSNKSAAERLVRRSGQMAVPQIDIDGHLIVGFDKARIDRLLST
jgi:glutaredoxin-like YruB-family protein